MATIGKMDARGAQPLQCSGVAAVTGKKEDRVCNRPSSKLSTISFPFYVPGLKGSTSEGVIRPTRCAPGRTGDG